MSTELPTEIERLAARARHVITNRDRRELADAIAAALAARDARIAELETEVARFRREPTEDEIVEAYIAASWKTGTAANRDVWLREIDEDECRMFREFARALLAKGGE